MFGNILLLAGVILIVYLLSRFALRNAKTAADYRKILLVVGVLSLFLLANGVLILAVMDSFRKQTLSLPMGDLSSIAEQAHGADIVLVGEVSGRNAPVTGDYIAYVESGQHIRSPKELWIDLKQGSIAITNDTYRAMRWRVSARDSIYIQAEQPVVVVGVVQRKSENASEAPTIQANLVYGGSHDDFVGQTRVKWMLSAALLASNGLVIIMILLFLLPKCLKGMKQRTVAAIDQS